MKRLLIGVTGGSGSGKTTLAQTLQERFTKAQILRISIDSYYRDRPDLSYEERSQLNFDHPDSIDQELLRDHLCALRAGEAVAQPVYDFTTHSRTGAETVEPASVILVEGILCLSLAAVRELLDLKVFVDTPPDLRVLRRLRRDVDERGRSVDSVIEQYLATVRPMHERFIEPTRDVADLVISGARDTGRALGVIEAWIRATL